MSHILPVSPLQAPWLLDMVVSRVAPVAFLTLSVLLPPIKEETGSPKSQSLKTKAPSHRKGTPYPH